MLTFGAWAVLLIGRLGFWQIVNGNNLSIQGQNQHTSQWVVPAIRGQILSADGSPLSISSEVYTLHANNSLDFDSISTIQAILDSVGDKEAAATAIVSLKNGYIGKKLISANMSGDHKVSLEKKNIPGLFFEKEHARFYPDASISAHLLGFVGKDELGSPKGYFGLEGYYNRQLSGLSGKKIEERDAFNRPIPIGNDYSIPVRNGDDLITSVDRTVQFFAHKHLQKGLEKYQATSGTVSVMDTKTGQILAMVSLPGYDPASYQDFEPKLYKNPIISDGYEPGSTFKVLVMSAALDSGAVKEDTVCNICSGPLQIAGYSIGSWNNKYYPNTNMTDVILHSDNVGMVFVARRLGRDKLLEYIQKFGFGRLTGIDMQEEYSPSLRPNNDWHELDWSTAAFGQGIAVTRLQMLTAVNALANKGRLVKPYLVTAIKSSDEIKSTPANKPQQIVSQLAAAKITKMMTSGVSSGEVRYYKPRGYLVAGKTGTAQVAIEGHYDENQSITSFIGFAPANDPKFTMLVTLKDPKSSPWGSTTAAPLWFDISKDLFRYYKIAPTE